MLTKPLLFAIIAVCGVLSGAAATPAEQPEKKPPDANKKGQQFCCSSVGKTAAGKGTGEGCVTIGPGKIDSCDKVLSCGDEWLKDDGKVTCL
jgi:hypothetical protein